MLILYDDTNDTDLLDDFIELLPHKNSYIAQRKATAHPQYAFYYGSNARIGYLMSQSLRELIHKSYADYYNKIEYDGQHRAIVITSSDHDFSYVTTIKSTPHECSNTYDELEKIYKSSKGVK